MIQINQTKLKWIKMNESFVGVLSLKYCNECILQLTAKEVSSTEKDTLFITRNQFCFKQQKDINEPKIGKH